MFLINYNFSPHVSVDNDTWVWICFGFDLTTFCLFALSYLAAHASASCANRFYDFNWKCTKPVSIYTLAYILLNGYEIQQVV